MSQKSHRLVTVAGGRPEFAHALVGGNNNNMWLPSCFDSTALIDSCYVWEIRAWHETRIERTRQHDLGVYGPDNVRLASHERIENANVD